MKKMTLTTLLAAAILATATTSSQAQSFRFGSGAVGSYSAIVFPVFHIYNPGPSFGINVSGLFNFSLAFTEFGFVTGGANGKMFLGGLSNPISAATFSVFPLSPGPSLASPIINRANDISYTFSYSAQKIGSGSDVQFTQEGILKNVKVTAGKFFRTINYRDDNSQIFSVFTLQSSMGPIDVTGNSTTIIEVAGGQALQGIGRVKIFR